MRKRIKFVKVIEHLLVALPLIYVGATALYTTFNKNAKDSYYGENVNDYIDTPLTDFNNLYDDEYYYYSKAVNSGGSLNIYFTNLEVLYSNNLPQSLLDSLSSYDYFRLNIGTDFISLYYSETESPFNSVWLAGLNNANYSFTFRFNILSTSISSSVTLDTGLVFTRQYNDYSFLNNAIPYAMSEFNKFGFNQIRFVQPFLNLFHVGETNVYIEFVNSFVNYFLFVECVYFTPMVLYWFIHFGEKIVCKVLDNEGGLDQ